RTHTVKCRDWGCQAVESHREAVILWLQLCVQTPHLRELDLRYNHPGDSGVRALSAAKLDTLTLLVDHGGENRTKPGPRKCESVSTQNTFHRYTLLCVCVCVCVCEREREKLLSYTNKHSNRNTRTQTHTQRYYDSPFSLTHTIR
ncbi:hypothetical protein ANANG_G00319820, partial [Anguilla anguilla]